MRITLRKIYAAHSIFRCLSIVTQELKRFCFSSDLLVSISVYCTRTSVFVCVYLVNGRTELQPYKNNTQFHWEIGVSH